MKQMDGRTAIVTGGASGIGRATAKLMAAGGANVVIADVDETSGSETVRLIEEKGGRATFIKTDVSDSSQVNDMVQAAVETYGGLDILLANAGVEGPGKLVIDTTDEDWEGVMDVNLTGVFRSCRAAIPEIAKRGGGAFAFTTSGDGIKPTSDRYASYCASKAGLISLTKTLAIECAPLRIRVNAVAPGETNTAMGGEAMVGGDPRLIEQLERGILLKRIAEPAEIAQVVLFLVSEASSYITGEVILADGGGMLCTGS